jgi:hypothetical protein
MRDFFGVPAFILPSGLIRLIKRAMQFAAHDTPTYRAWHVHLPRLP